MKSRPIAVPPDTIGGRSLKLLEYEIAIVLEYLIAMVRILSSSKQLVRFEKKLKTGQI